MNLAAQIRDIPDFPQKGVLFKDITTLLLNPQAFHEAVDQIYDRVQDLNVDIVAAVESRGFIIGAPIAYRLNAGFVPIRKPGKLPGATIQVEYSLEYGKNALEIHTDAIRPGQRVLVVDDLLATGGSVKAAINLVERLKGQVVGVAFLVELLFLDGRQKLEGYNTFSIVQY
ncbi:MAG: adenine phosphoribosyltransferase [Anaerolineae bacterium]